MQAVPGLTAAHIDVLQALIDAHVPEGLSWIRMNSSSEHMPAVEAGRISNLSALLQVCTCIMQC